MSELEQQKISESPEKELPGKKKKNKKVKEKRPLWQEILSWVLTLLCAFAAAMVIRSVIFEPVRVDGESMDDTLADKEAGSPDYAGQSEFPGCGDLPVSCQRRG